MLDRAKSRNYSSKAKKNIVNNYMNKHIPKQTTKSININKSKMKLRPPFNPGFFSYNKSINNNNQKKKNIHSRNTKINNNNNDFFLSNTFSINPKDTKNSSNQQNSNYLNSIIFSSVNKKIHTNNSLLSHSSINLNKYKINIQNISNIRRKIDNNEKNNVNNFVNKSINLNINFNYEKRNKPLKENNIILIPCYKNYFKSSKKHEIESRRMLLEYTKLLNKKEKNVKQILLKNNISSKILNKKLVNVNDINSTKINSDDILLGETSKNIYLNNINYSFFGESKKNSNIEEYYEHNKNNAFSNKFIKINNETNNNFSFINSLNSQNHKKIKLINFLFVPKILNLIQPYKKSEKYIFAIVPDENTYIKGIESYKFIMRNILNNEIENEFYINDIQECYINEKKTNRFIIKVKYNNDNNKNIEIETPSNEICEYYVNGILYLSKESII